MKRLFPKGVQLSQRGGSPYREITVWTPKQILVPLYPKGVGIAPVGAKVARGQRLGEEGGFAPESGVIREYREIYHPLLGKVLCASLNLEPCKPEDCQDTAKLPGVGQGILKSAKNSGITDECTGLPLWKRMEQLLEQPPAAIAADVLEDEPLCPSTAFFLWKLADILKGLELLAEFLGGIPKKIAWNSKTVGKKLEGMPASYSLELGARYPAWTLYEKGAEKEKAAHIGPQAAAALAEAVLKGAPQTHTAIAVGGDAVPEQQVLWVPIGARVQDILEYCGVGARPCTVIMGNEINGRTVIDGEVPIIAASRCLTAWKPEGKKLDDRIFPCIGCGRCQSACPKGLEPWMVQEALGQEPIVQRMLWHVEDCCQCGVCRIVCPSGIDLPACMRQAAELRKRGGLV